jgi:CheY-like chemotaxis protein
LPRYRFKPINDCYGLLVRVVVLNAAGRPQTRVEIGVCCVDPLLAALLNFYHLILVRGRSKLKCRMSSRRSSGTRNLSEVRRVLIVDDNHDSAELIALVLNREGHETRVAYDPREAIPSAIQFRPHIAFLDIGLPWMDGFELLRALRGKPELAGCMFVAVTGYEELAQSSGGAGFDAHLVKPIDLSALATMVMSLTQPDPAFAKPASA